MKKEVSKEKFNALCVEAIKDKKISIYEIPKQLRTYEMYLEWIKINPKDIKNVPRKMIDEKMCDEAVSKWMFAASDIPTDFQTPEFFFKHTKKDPSILLLLPKHLRTEEFYKIAVTLHVNALYSVYEDLKTYDICLEAVRENGLAITDVPDKFLDMNLCQTAVFSNPKAARYVPTAIKQTTEWKEFAQQFISSRRKEIKEDIERKKAAQKRMDDAYEIYKNMF